MLVVANLRVGGFFEGMAEWAIDACTRIICFRPSSLPAGLLSAFLVVVGLEI
jgi:hypothetical protein